MKELRDLQGTKANRKGGKFGHIAAYYRNFFDARSVCYHDNHAGMKINSFFSLFSDSLYILLVR